MTDQDRDERLLRYVEGELSQLEELQVENALADDPELRRQVEDLQAIVTVAATKPSMPSDLYEHAENELLTRLGRGAKDVPLRYTRLKALVFAVAAALVAAIWLGAGASVAQAVGGWTKNVRVILLGSDGDMTEAVETSGAFNVTGDTLRINMALGGQPANADGEQSVKIAYDSDNDSIVFRASTLDTLRIETDLLNAGTTVIRTWKGNDTATSAVKESEDTGHAKPVLSDSTQEASLGRLKKAQTP